MENWDTCIEVGRPGEFIAIGRAGWLFWHLHPFKHDVRVETVEDDGGRLVVHSLVVAACDTLLGPGSIAPTEIRDIALGRVEGLINSPEYAPLVRGALTATSGSDYSPSGCPVGLAVRKAEDRPFVRQDRTLRIEIPAGRHFEDDFYREVGQTYAIAYQTSQRPAADIAEATGVPVTRVHRWLKEARRRGLMSPARRTPGQIAIDESVEV